jgi:LEA14-like dessication related protein
MAQMTDSCEQEDAACSRQPPRPAGPGSGAAAAGTPKPTDTMPGRDNIMPILRLIAFPSLLVILVCGCAVLQPGYAPPVVHITSFKAVPAEGTIPQFEIRLHIINPNRSPLELEGIAYTIALEGYKIMTGVSNQLPAIDAYGEGHVTLTASVDLFSSIGFVSDLIRNRERDQIAYRFSAKLDTGTMVPLIRVTQEGELSLKPSSASQ